MSENISFTSHLNDARTISSMHVFDPPEAFPDLPALAERLGVAKQAKGERASVALTMKNGDTYSLFALINAFLDRLDAAQPPPPKDRA